METSLTVCLPRPSGFELATLTTCTPGSDSILIEPPSRILRASSPTRHKPTSGTVMSSLGTSRRKSSSRTACFSRWAMLDLRERTWVLWDTRIRRRSAPGWNSLGSIGLPTIISTIMKTMASRDTTHSRPGRSATFQSGLGYLMTYTYGLSLGNADSINADRLPLEDPRSGWGRNTFDVRQRFTSAVMYELPFGQGKRFLRSSSRTVNGLVGGWQANMIYNAQTPYPISIQVSPCLQNGGSLRTCPPNLIGADHGALGRGQRTLTEWFNTAAFSAPAPYTLGNMQTWSLSGPYGLNNWDTSMIKNTKIRERMTLQFRAEFFNFFNHPQFNGVNTTLGSASFGQINSATDERNIQFALKLLF